MSLTRPSRPSPAGGCHECPVRCEKVVYPAGCIDAECPSSYSYEHRGRLYFGCVEKVFRVEIDRALFDEMQAQPGGFGGLRVVRDPFPICRSEVDRTFEHRMHGGCVNPDFLLSGSGPQRTVEIRPRTG